MFRSEDEIAKVYVDHIESLRLSGLPFDEASIRHEWSQALDAFRRDQKVIEGED